MPDLRELLIEQLESMHPDAIDYLAKVLRKRAMRKQGQFPLSDWEEMRPMVKFLRWYARQRRRRQNSSYLESKPNEN